jgi:hypothetical protein
VTAARRRSSSTDQHLAGRAAELGFRSLQAYLADRAVIRRWPSTSIASELGVQAGTVRDRLDQHGLPRRRRPGGPTGECAAEGLLGGQAAGPPGRAGVRRCGGDLRVHRVGQGCSLRLGCIASAGATTGHQAAGDDVSRRGPHADRMLMMP